MSIKVDFSKVQTKPPGGDLLVGLILTSEERDFLSKSTRCGECGHLNALHSGHCCCFCTVPGCKCNEGGYG